MRRPYGFEQCPGAVEVDPVTLVEVRLRLTGHHRREMEDQIGPALDQALGLAGSRQVRGDQLDLTGGTAGCCGGTTSARVNRSMARPPTFPSATSRAVSLRPIMPAAPRIRTYTDSPSHTPQDQN